MNRRIQTFLILLVILFTTGCGGGSNKAKKAQVKITNFTTTNSENPTIEDYEVTGFSAINESNINRVNKLLREMPSDEVDTFEEIKVVIDEILDNKIPPKLVILGDNPVTQNKGATYEDRGARASDDRDGNITEYINIVSDVNSSKAGNYTVIYSVEDSAGNKELATRKVSIILNTGSSIVTPEDNHTVDTVVPPENNVTKLIIEDAEDQNIDCFTIEYNKSEKAKISNIYDDEKGSRVIFLDGDAMSGFSCKRKSIWRGKYIQWSMKTNEKFVVRFMVDTKKGERVIEYHPKDTGTGLGKHSYNQKEYIFHGIGADTTNGEWHTFTRDLDYDIKRYEEDNKFHKIKEISISGKIKIDDITLYSSANKLKIDKSVVVSAPGVVLTFDDSYVDSWDKVIPYFEEKGVVATFFCHKWDSKVKGDLTEAEVALLKQFVADGHEVGYHTKDHVGTKDRRYDNYTTIEAKANAYFKGQIKPGVKDMRKRGFEPESFSYPYITGQPEHNKIIRETLPHIREFFADVYVMDKKPTAGSKTLEEIKTFLDEFKQNKEVGVLLGHFIEQKGETGSNSVPIKKLKAIIEYASKIGLKFYTLKEAHNIYLNQ